MVKRPGKNAVCVDCRQAAIGNRGKIKSGRYAASSRAYRSEPALTAFLKAADRE